MIKQTIDQDIKSAMLSGDKRTVNALRTLKSAILSVEIAEGKREEGLEDAKVVALLQKEQKKRAEAAALYEQGGNAESAAEEKFEESLIQKYLPVQLNETQISGIIEVVICQLGNEATMKDMGRIIAGVKEKADGAADGGTVARLVKERLS